jgi:hypothetical protein
VATSDIFGEGNAPTAVAVSAKTVQNSAFEENIPDAPFFSKTDLFVNAFIAYIFYKLQYRDYGRVKHIWNPMILVRSSASM